MSLRSGGHGQAGTEHHDRRSPIHGRCVVGTTATRRCHACTCGLGVRELINRRPRTVPNAVSFDRNVPPFAIGRPEGGGAAITAHRKIVAAPPAVRRQPAAMLLESLSILLAAAAVSVPAGSGQAFPSHPNPHEADQDSTIEIRVYTLKDGTRGRFHATVERDAIPLLRRANIEVVAYGPSSHDELSYYLVRAFCDLADRTRSEDAFYGSAEWQLGPRATIMSAIDHYSTMVVHVSPEAVRSLRESLAGGNAVVVPGSAAQRVSDAPALLALTRLTCAQRRPRTSGASRRSSRTISASLADGSHVNREAFLTLVASPSTITDLRAHDVDVRLMGDFAIVHARTTFTTNDGRSGASRYTDVWARRSGRWLCIAAQVTRYELPKDRRD
jgi:Domain of unknown function (DUF4440)/NIPSNAP